MPNNVEPLTITQNKTIYTAEDGHGYSPVTVNVDVGYEPNDFADNSIRTKLSGDIVLSTATKINAYAFYRYTNITSITGNNVASMGSNSVTGCSSLTSVNLPKLTTLTAAQFKELTNLVTVNLDNVKVINNLVDIFRGCTKLENVSLKTLHNLYSQNMFYGCTSLEYLVLPELSMWISGAATSPSYNFGRLGGNFLYGCTNLKAFDIYTTYKFDESSIFQNCSSLDTLIIRNLTSKADTVPALTNINSFTGTPFASDGTGGTLYVPNRYISRYQSATNWSTILNYTNNQILPIEGSYYETHYADGTPIPVSTYTEVTFTRDDNKIFNDENGGYTNNTQYDGSAFITANGNTNWQILTTTNPSNRYIYIQQFNGDSCIKVSYIKTITRRLVDNTDYYALNFTTEDECTKFRFSLSVEPEKLFIVTEEA